jgi:hypothetical protein
MTWGPCFTSPSSWAAASLALATLGLPLLMLSSPDLCTCCCTCCQVALCCFVFLENFTNPPRSRSITPLLGSLPSISDVSLPVQCLVRVTQEDLQNHLPQPWPPHNWPFHLPNFRIRSLLFPGPTPPSPSCVTYFVLYLLFILAHITLG